MNQLSISNPATGERIADAGVGLTLSTYGIQTFTRPKAWHLRKP